MLFIKFTRDPVGENKMRYFFSSMVDKWMASKVIPLFFLKSSSQM